MAAPFKCDEKVSIERKTGATDPDSGVELDVWEVVYDHYWASVQDSLPSRSESTKNGMSIDVLPSRLRMQGAGGATTEMRAVLHSRGDRIAQIISGPAMLDDRVHYEFMIEGFKHG
ncbi:hypothetical protein CR152_31975 [Massilia violaceinigra]|uniref:Head-tail adaptor protein n=1 Tax=Massilia violaceinigra TaxID=2045208 RepID=A0A2D2DUG8_9BURK|nr:head-tail adaptor protein [Massilia violaceinigra]ATQ74853.1 hypothetical protein CR152_10205 [Massilia violaceinigra]ATQ78624.1 hypothetical protein CR152_31975 [Massilia violaceinigra]